MKLKWEKKMKKFLVCFIGSCVSSTALLAGGIERTALSTSHMYETGNYTEVSYISSDYNVTAPTLAPNKSVFKDLSDIAIAAKFNVNDNLSFGLSQYNQAGVSLDYVGAGGTGTYNGGALPTGTYNVHGPKVDLNLDALTFMGRYRINENFSSIIGIKNTTVDNATADIFRHASAAITTAAQIAGGTESSYLASVAYERSDIALRVELLYEQEASFKLATTGGHPSVGGQSTTTASVPDYKTINFQTGIAEGTLVFGSIRMADWKNHQIAVAPATQASPTSDFKNSTTNSIGLGRKISDKLSMSLSTKWENGSESSGTSTLSPTNGYTGYALGAKYTIDALTISGGINYTSFGDKTVSPTLSTSGKFSGNTVLSYAVKLGINF